MKKMAFLLIALTGSRLFRDAMSDDQQADLAGVTNYASPSVTTYVLPKVKTTVTPGATANVTPNVRSNTGQSDNGCLLNR
jgi:hypothetical protein